MYYQSTWLLSSTNGHTLFFISCSLITVSKTGSHEHWKTWKTWKITKKSSMHGKIMEFEKY